VVVTVPAGASCWASAARLLSVVALVSKNRGAHPGHHGAVRAGRGDQHHALPRQQPAEQPRGVRGNEVRVPGQPAGLLVVLRAQVVGGTAEFPLGELQAVGERPVERGRAQHDADGQGEEHRDEGNQVIAEINHQKRPVSQ
jgi:hypothetical protein